jgi:hypothetical protein
MAFPNDHAYPLELPLWKVDGHRLRAGERIQATQYEQGEDRHREIRTFTPMLASVSTVLRQAEWDRLIEWHEADIQGGVLPFDTQVAGLNGTPHQWWAAMFVGPIRTEAYGLGIYTVTAELVLLEGPYDDENLPPGADPSDPPRLAPSLSARLIGEGSITARFDAGTMRAWLDGEGDIELTSTNSMSARLDGEGEVEAELTLQTNFLLLEDGVSYLLLEGGTDRIFLEP